MKFFGAIAAYSFIAFILAWGILQAVQGHYWLLIVGVLAYLAAFAKFGCLPPQSHH